MRPFLNDDECLTLHVALLKDTIEKTRGLNRILYLSGSGSLPIEVELPIRQQVGNDLGARMLNAFKNELAENAKVVIIGTDSPTLSIETIKLSFDKLSHNDAVFGPAEDGGYYLIGMSKLIPEIFEGIQWGEQDVLQQTLQKIGSHRFALLETCFDIDTPKDLDRLKKILPEFPELMNLTNWCGPLG